MKDGWMESASRDLREATYAHAVQFGLSPEDADDCAGGLVARILGIGKETIEEVQRNGSFTAWRDVCMRRHIVSYCREVARRRWAMLPDAASLEAGGGQVISSDHPGISPETGVLQGEFRDRFAAALAQLASPARDVVIRHVIYGESIRDLAAALGRKPHAVSESCSTALRRIRAILRRQGMTDEEVGEYLALFERARPPVVVRERGKGPGEKKGANLKNEP
jgi:RNA polymerase sigma factor (sigma-70 family)